MEALQQRLVEIEADTAALRRRVGDLVRSGEVVGRDRHGDVRVPFDAVVESIYCDTKKEVMSLTLSVCGMTR